VTKRKCSDSKHFNWPFSYILRGECDSAIIVAIQEAARSFDFATLHLRFAPTFLTLVTPSLILFEAFNQDNRSGITNDLNRADDPEYIVRLIGQVITVSVETGQLVRRLNELSIVETASS
jgi:hypothetical protein